MVAVLVLAGQAAAEPPPYLLLTPPHAELEARPAEVDGRGTHYPRHASRYAYGWFGAHARRHWARHFGYYRNYTEWSGR
jgi:hypothetical protein